jgi:hypothetical protein
MVEFDSIFDFNEYVKDILRDSLTVRKVGSRSALSSETEAVELMLDGEVISTACLG